MNNWIPIERCKFCNNNKLIYRRQYSAAHKLNLVSYFCNTCKTSFQFLLDKNILRDFAIKIDYNQYTITVHLKENKTVIFDSSKLNFKDCHIKEYDYVIEGLTPDNIYDRMIKTLILE